MVAYPFTMFDFSPLILKVPLILVNIKCVQFSSTPPHISDNNEQAIYEGRTGKKPDHLSQNHERILRVYLVSDH